MGEKGVGESRDGRYRDTMVVMFRLALAVLLFAPEASARVALDRTRLQPVPLPGRSSPLPGRPSWLKVDGNHADLEKAAAKIERATVLLARTATGRSLSPTLAAKGGTVRVNEGGSFYVTDSANEVSVGPEFILSRTDETAAVLFSHELEHLNQRALGLSGETARGVREMAAFIVQTRVWVELGASLRESDLDANWNNSHDMNAALDYPATVSTVLAYRSGWRGDLSDKKVRAYWNTVLEEDAQWRAKWRAKFPKRNSRESAYFVLNQALNFNGINGEVSAWLPDVLESLMSLRKGKSLLLPVEPTEADKALLNSHVLAPKLVRGKSGSWGLVLP